MTKPLNMSVILAQWLNAQMQGVRVAIPAVVESYDATKRTAQILPGVKTLLDNGATIDMKPLLEVPCRFPGGQGWGLHCELSPGDTGYLIIMDTSIGNWLDSDGSIAVTPEDSTRFTLQDAVFEPGLFPWSTVPSGIPAKGLSLTYGETSILLDAGVTVVDGNGNTLEMGTSSVKINGNFEVLQ